MQKSQRNGAEQEHARPVENCLHVSCLRLRAPVYKVFLARALGSGFTVLLMACNSSEPSGQVLAVVDGTEVTYREVQQEARSGASAGDAAGSALHRTVARKVLAQEARKRGLERDAEFHFELRRARDRLLAEALERQLRREVQLPDREETLKFVEANPWRYRQRFALELAPVGSDNRLNTTVLDSASFSQRPPEALMRAHPRDTLELGGGHWRVVERRKLAGSREADFARARQDLVDAQVQQRLRDIVAYYRQAGKIRYQRD